MPADPAHEDLDLLADFVLEAVKTGKVDLLKGMKLGGSLKRQAGNLDGAMGHLVRRYCREDERAAAIIELAKQQSPAFAGLAERWGLAAKDAEPTGT